MLSIITNFGCHYNCPYCIVKNTGISVPKTTIKSLDNLLQIYQQGKYDGISLSGGGDPMYQYDKHIDYYNRLFDICDKHNIPLELHTSYIDNNLPYNKFNRVVFHLRTLSQIFEVERINTSAIKRIVFVVDESFTKEKIDTIYTYSVNIVPELSFRQMVDSDYNCTDYCKNYLREGHKKKWYYIEQCDYNTYFAEGIITDKYDFFLTTKKEKKAE